MKTKIRKVIGALTILAFVSTAQAQIFSGGIMAGVNTGAVKIDNIGQGFTNVINGSNINGFEAGLYAKFMLNPFYIKPMALYNFGQGTVNYHSGDGTSYSTNFSLHKAEVPILVGLNIIGHYLSIEAGPVYNYIFSVTNNYNDNNVSVAKNGIGYRAGLASELGPIMLYAAYGGAVYNSSSVQNATFREPSKLVFGAALKLGRMGNSHQNKNDRDRNDRNRE